MTSAFGKVRFGAAPASIGPLSTGVPGAVYPGAVVNTSRLAVAVDRLQTRLAIPLAAGDTQMIVQDGSGIVATILLTIDNEIVQVLSGAANTWQISRGFDGTTPALHLGSALVSGFINAWHHNALVAEVTAIEQALGPNLANIATAGTFNSGLYDFAAQAPGGTLAPGLNVVTLSPVPRGVNGSNTKHYLYISGGTGTAEAVLIGGGSAVSGAASGTVFVTCANAHSGAWTIRTATKGIQEAEKSLPPEGGIVVIPTGNLQMQAPISFQRKRTFQGMGVSTRLIPASASAIVFDSNLPVHPDSAYDIQSDDIWFQDFVIDGHATATNTMVGIRHIAQNFTEIHSIVGVRFDRVYFNNIRVAILMHRVADVSIHGCRSYANTEIRFTDLRHDMNHNYDIQVDDFFYSWRTMDGDVAHPTLSGVAVLHFEFGELVYISNCQMDLAGGTGATGMDGIAWWGGGEDLSIVNTVIVNARKGLDLSPTDWVGGPFTTIYPGYVHMCNVSMDSLWGYAVSAADGVSSNFLQNVHNVEMVNCLFTNPHVSAAVPVSGIVTGAYAQHWQMSNVQINGALASNPFTLVGVGANAQFIAFNGVQLQNGSGIAGSTLGIFIGANTGVYGLDSVLFDGLTTNINDAGNSITSAAAIALPPGRTTVYISGSVSITSIAASPYDREFQRVTLVFPGGGITVVDGGNMRLAGNFVATGFSTLTLQFISNLWIEISRSAN